MANRKNMKRRRRRSRGRRRNSTFSNRHRHYGMNPRHRRRRRRNPIGGRIGELGKTALWAIGGGIWTRSLPQMLLKEKNVGVFGYLANAAAAGIGSALATRFAGAPAGNGVLIGGAVMIAGRAFEEFVGKKVVEFTGVPGLLGQYGDTKYDLSGVYFDSYFAVPTISNPGLVTAPPAVSVEQVKAVTNMAGLGKYGSNKYGGGKYAN
ncbi:MAG: hypothetical protein L0212_04145 [Acidobacteria bacterium]|nr:hypothetical protein [Acidobacteriota bacterium]